MLKKTSAHILQRICGIHQLGAFFFRQARSCFLLLNKKLIFYPDIIDILLMAACNEEKSFFCRENWWKFRKKKQKHTPDSLDSKNLVVGY